MAELPAPAPALAGSSASQRDPFPPLALARTSPPWWQQPILGQKHQTLRFLHRELELTSAQARLGRAIRKLQKPINPSLVKDEILLASFTAEEITSRN
jgi:hypothetical protein